MTATRFAPSFGRVIGKPAGSLASDGSSFAVSERAAKFGEAGERATADLLFALANTPGGPTVMHDLMFRSSRGGKTYAFNVDHLVVSGRTVYVIDSKVWKAGRYFSLGSRAFGPKRPVDYKDRDGKQTRRFTAAEKQTMVMALEHLTTIVAGKGKVARPALLAVWPPSKKGVLSLRWLRVPGAKAMPAEKAVAWLSRKASKAADPVLVAALEPYVVALQRRR